MGYSKPTTSKKDSGTAIRYFYIKTKLVFFRLKNYTRATLVARLDQRYRKDNLASEWNQMHIFKENKLFSHMKCSICTAYFDSPINTQRRKGCEKKALSLI